MKMTACRRNHKNTGTTVKFEAANYPEQEHRPGERGTNNRTEEEEGGVVGWLVFEGGAERYRKENRAMSQPPNQAADC